MGRSLALLDAGPLYAAADADDADHGRVVAALAEGFHLVVPTLVVAEATYFVGRRLGAAAEARFLSGLESLEVEAPIPDDWARMAELVEHYANFPLGGTDASVVALAERLDVQVVITLDRRHFGSIRPRHCDAFQIVP